MKKIVLLILVLTCFNVFAKDETQFELGLKGTNSEFTRVISIESRSSGYHAIYFDTNLPDLGCDTNQRGVILDADTGSELMISLAQISLQDFRRVIARVEGCTIIETGVTYTAPKIIKIQLYR